MTTAILPQEERRATAQSPQQQLAAALNIAADSGRILRVMASQWSDGRVSYRISVEKNGKLKDVHRLYQERETMTINDVLWSLTDGRWSCRPAYQGAGFMVYHPDYSAYLSRQTRDQL
jgi:hypothetical protein